MSLSQGLKESVGSQAKNFQNRRSQWWIPHSQIGSKVLFWNKWRIDKGFLGKSLGKAMSLLKQAMA